MRKFLWSAVTVAVVLGAIAWWMLSHRTFAADATAQSGNADAAPAVQLATVRYGAFPVVLDENGFAGAPAGAVAQLGFPNPGVLRTLYVRAGDRVRAGEPLAALDARSFALAASSARADQATAEIAARNASIALARERRLYTAGIVARKDVEDASAAESIAQAQTQSAADKAALAANDLDRATLRSPVDGVVTAVLRRAGEPVDPTTPVVVVSAAAQNVATLRVPSTDAAQIAAGDPVDLTVGGSRSHVMARVTAVVPAIDPGTQTATVTVDGLPEGTIAGTAVHARISVALLHGLLVPQSAIVADPQGGDDVVFEQQRRKDGSSTFAPVTVTVEHENAETALIGSGLRPGARIAAQGAFELLAPAGGGD